MEQSGVDLSIDGCGLIVSQQEWDGREGCVAMDIVAPRSLVLHQPIVDQFRPVPAMDSLQ